MQLTFSLTIPSSQCSRSCILGLSRSNKIIYAFILLGFLFEPVCLIMPLTLYGFSQVIVLLHHTYDTFVSIAFLLYSLQTRTFENSSINIITNINHSNHEYFIDHRPIGYISYLYDTFLYISIIRVTLSRLQRALVHLNHYQLICTSQSLWKAFQDVTPSFYFSS